jgi:hypothetical protein
MRIAHAPAQGRVAQLEIKMMCERSPREEAAIWIKSDPQLDNLHSDPRWRTVLERMNFHVD